MNLKEEKIMVELKYRMPTQLFNEKLNIFEDAIDGLKISLKRLIMIYGTHSFSFYIRPKQNILIEMVIQTTASCSVGNDCARACRIQTYYGLFVDE